MKMVSVILFACLGAAWAQTQSAPAAPPVAPPGMAAPAAAPALPDLPKETVIAQFDDGWQLTMGEFRQLMGTMPPQTQQFVMRNPQAYVRQIGVMRKLAHMAEQQKLGEQSPYKEQIETTRLQILAGAKLTEEMNSIMVEPDELLKYYDTSKDKYRQVKVKALYVSFSDSSAANAGSAKKPRTEDEAKAKITSLLAEIRAGGSFETLVRDNSDDETSKAKEGDFGVWRVSDNIPDALRSAAFALKQGDVSEPVRQPNGFYLLKADEVSYRPLSEVRNDIYQTLRGEHYGKWVHDIDASVKVEFPNATFLGTPAADTKK